MTLGETSLAELRQEIDAIDDSLHDLLMRRGDVQAHVGRAKSGDGVYIRPGREALVLRRLMARHQGSFPKPALVRIWREIFAAGLSLQGDFSVAVPTAGNGAMKTLAVDHFGALTPTLELADAGEVLAAVRRGDAAVGVLPMPQPGEAEPWWRRLARDPGAPPIIARLPFAAPASRAGDAEALAVGAAPAEDTGNDRSFLALEATGEATDADVSTAVTDAGFEPVAWQTAPADNGGGRLHLLETPGVVVPGDNRLETLAGTPAVADARALGSYAVPLTAAELA
ncbi:chorismate mutase [Limimonas halophila]|uniref:chorismate mutase n=1 Tax=Limimonas halophila TaxID=1082479 RepID=A0A1G7TRM4_9PROT|nr:chorismate mutase [Limimonas halophila]SDG37965.1 chorismate mutase [Limimonas halophila]